LAGADTAHARDAARPPARTVGLVGGRGPRADLVDELLARVQHRLRQLVRLEPGRRASARRLRVLGRLGERGRRAVGEVAADRARRVGVANHRLYHRDHARTVQHERQRRPGDERAGARGRVGLARVARLGGAARDVDHLEADHAKAAALKAANDLGDEPALHCVGQHEDGRELGHGGDGDRADEVPWSQLP
jgi:hypothetical protein